VGIGNSTKSAEFIADNLLWWWERFGMHHYYDASCLLILCIVTIIDYQLVNYE
jgi:hypothetical protein